MCLVTIKFRHLYSIFTHIYFLLIEKDLNGCENVSVIFLCALLSLLSGNISIFFGQEFSLLSLFFGYLKICFRVLFCSSSGYSDSK
jgi:hypothetical protein